ncbi:MAG: metallophosphoesterase, partial [Myxococcales bacterium]|nr:metallophosphoesterase [Myxococcales bacterium]
MSTFTLVSLIGHLTVTFVAWRQRGRAFAIFAFAYIGIYTAISFSLRSQLPSGPLLPVLQGLIYFHFLMLARPKLRPVAYRALVSIPASAWTAGTVLALPWAVAGGLGFEPHGLWIPYALAAIGTYQSLRARREEKDLHLDGLTVAELARHPLGEGRVARPLRIVQITDPHLGPFMSEERLAAICRRAVAWEPDLVLLTGDFLTMEGQGSPEALGRALAPLKELQGRTFACRGNHDLESPRIVARGLAQA